MWPERQDSFVSLPLYLTLLALFLPAAFLGFQAWGPAAWDATQPGSVPGRFERAWGMPTPKTPATGQSAGDPPAPASTPTPPDTKKGPLEEGFFPTRTLRLLEAFLGEAQATRTSSPLELSRQISRTTFLRLRMLLLPQEPSHLGLWARGLLGLACFLFPMSLLAVAKLQSAFAAFHLPLLLRTIARAPLAYLAVVVIFLLQDGLLLLGFLVPAPLLLARLNPWPAYLLAVASFCALGVALSIASGVLLGRFYRERAPRLAWE